MKFEDLYYIARPEPLFSNELEKKKAYVETFVRNKVGRKVLMDLISMCGNFRTAFNTESERQTQVNLGKQIVGIHLINILEAEIKKERKDDL